MSDPRSQQPVPVPAFYPPAYDDEIDLFELAAGLWRQRRLIAACTALAVLLAAVYAFILATPVYQAEARLRPPSTAALAPLTVPALDSSDIEGPLSAPQLAAVFQRVVSMARSSDARRPVYLTRRGAFTEALAESPADAAAFRRRFLTNFDFDYQGPDKRNPEAEPRLTVSFQHPSPPLAASVVNETVDEARSRVRANLIEEFRSVVGTQLDRTRARLAARTEAARLDASYRITRLEEADAEKRKELQDQLEAARARSAAEREDRMAQLRDAVETAETLGLEEPTSLAALSLAKGARDGLQVTNLQAAEGADQPLFLRGTTLLRAELAELTRRASDDAYAPKVRELESQLQLLENNREVETLSSRENFTPFTSDAADLQADIASLEALLARDFTQVEVLRIDQRASPPAAPVAPRRALILALALVLGGMVGVLVALVRNAVAARTGDRTG
jgi:LPS O-antigen subunit length determinant protein (WzzB/FepE family)